MGTHKINADLDVNGEVQGTSLDINGAADIAGNLVVSSGGDITCGDDLFMPNGGIINFNSGDVTVTHASNQLTVAGGSLFFNFGNGNYNTADGTTILDSEDNDLISFGEQAVTFSATNVSIGGTLNVAEDIVHTSDADTKINFANNVITLTAGNHIGATLRATGTTISKRVFDITSSTDGDAIGDIVYFGSTTSMQPGRIYYFNSSGNWALADANAESTAKGLLGVALGSSSDSDGVLIRGMVTLDHDPGAVGDVLFLSDQTVSSKFGCAKNSAPSGNGDIVRVIGYCLHVSAGNIFFNPSADFIEVTA